MNWVLEFMAQRVYDEEAEEPAAEEKKPEAVQVDDPAVIIKDSLRFGLEALNLYFGDDNANQAEQLEVDGAHCDPQ